MDSICRKFGWHLLKARKNGPKEQGLTSKPKKVDVGYVELAKRLKRHGFKDETEASITNKLKRETFSAVFLLATLAALDSEGLRLEDL